MRNRQLWIQNVVTHELSHVFSLRRAAYSPPVDAINCTAGTYNTRTRSTTLPKSPGSRDSPPPGTWKASPSSKPI